MNFLSTDSHEGALTRKILDNGDMGKKTIQSEWISVTKFFGMDSLHTAIRVPEGYAADSLNSDLGSSSQAGPMKGYSKFGNQANAANTIVRKYAYQKGDGVEVMLHVRDNGTNYIVEYLNQEDTRNNINGEWSILETGLTRSVNKSDGTTTNPARFSFVAFNTTGTNKLVYGNGVEGLRRWNGATAAVGSTTATTIVISVAAGTVSLSSRGFAASGSVIINGTTYVYTSIAAQTFSGVTPNPTGEAVNSGIAQIVNTAALAAVDKGSVIISAQERIFMAGITATPNQVDYSTTGDETTYSGSLPTSGGFEDFPQMNGEIVALSFIKDYILVFSEKKVIAFKFEFPTSTTKVTRLLEISDEGAASHKAVKKFNDQVWYLTPKGGIKRITQVSAENAFAIEDMTEFIRPTIKNFIWTDGALEYSQKDKLWFAAGRTDKTVSNNNMTVMMWYSDDGSSAGIGHADGQSGKIWNLGMTDTFIGDMCIFKKELHFGSSVASNDYLMFDGFSRDGGPYLWRRTERVETFGNPWERKWIQYLALRGAIGPGTTLKATLKYGINGNVSSQLCQIKGTDTAYVVQTPLNMLGGFSLGTEPLGGTIEGIGDLNPFLVIFELPPIYEREFQLMFECDTGLRVVVETYGYKAESAEQLIEAVELKSTGN